jgi:hypothetical protein
MTGEIYEMELCSSGSFRGRGVAEYRAGRSILVLETDSIGDLVHRIFRIVGVTEPLCITKSELVTLVSYNATARKLLT